MDISDYKIYVSRHFALTWMRKWDYDKELLRRELENAYKIDRVGKNKYFFFDLNNPVSASMLRDFVGSLELNRVNKGVFITTSTFTEAARNAIHGPCRVILIDGELLSKLMIDYNIGVATKVAYEVKEIDTDYFSEE